MLFFYVMVACFMGFVIVSFSILKAVEIVVLKFSTLI